MKVSVITPTASGRAQQLKNCIRQFLSQDYADKEMIIVGAPGDCLAWEYPEYGKSVFWIDDIGNEPIGTRRNAACQLASGDIIVHMDDDDIYAPDWISRSVDALQQSTGNITGLSSAYFQTPDHLYLYEYPANAQPYVCEATMCYWRSFWDAHPFPDIRAGEGLYFCGAGRLKPHNYIDGFTAIIHGSNTASHKQLGSKEFTLVR